MALSMFYWAFRAGRSDKEWALAPTASDRPQTSPAGTSWSPCPRLRLAGSTPFVDCVPHCRWQWLPLLVYQWIEAFLKKSFSSGPSGQSESGRFGRFACKSSESFATAQRAECLLRSDTRGPSQSKAICARHAVGVASGHSLSGIRALLFRENSAYFA